MDLMDVRDRVKDLPIEDVLYDELQWVGKKPLCPFHDDRRPGSFVVNKRKNWWCCYSCGKGGDAIHFFEEKYGMNFVEATSKIAITHGVVSQSEMETILKTKVDPSGMLAPRAREVIKENRPQIATSEVLDKVYQLLSHGMQYVNKPKLTEKHRETLREHYGFSDEEIEKDGLFSWPTSAISKKFFAALFANGLTEKELSTVPGLFFNKSTDTWDFFRPKNTSAIGVPIRNIDGELIGFQMRLDRKKEGGQRYQWFSSSFADGNNTQFIKGTSSGSPIDVVYPKELKCAAVFITEGHFKAIKLANQYGAIVLSVQGVGMWRYIPAVMDELNRREPKLRYVYIAYDADMAYKETVLSPAMKLGLSMTGLDFEGVKDEINDILAVGFRAEEYSNLHSAKRAKKVSDYLVAHPIHKYIVNFCLWNDEYGKGIDDLIKSGHITDIKKMSLIDFWNNTFHFLQAADKERKRISEENEIPFQDVTLLEEDKRKLFQKHIFSKL